MADRSKQANTRSVGVSKTQEGHSRMKWQKKVRLVVNVLMNLVVEWWLFENVPWYIQAYCGTAFWVAFIWDMFESPNK